MAGGRFVETVIRPFDSWPDFEIKFGPKGPPDRLQAADRNVSSKTRATHVTFKPGDLEITGRALPHSKGPMEAGDIGYSLFGKLGTSKVQSLSGTLVALSARE